MAPKMLLSKHLLNHVRFALLVLTALIVVSDHFIEASANDNNNKDVSRKSIVFDIKTPKVFYCPQEKQSDSSKMIVKAKPLDKLCEFDGKSKPKGSLSDCYNDVDETEFACDEKKRFLLRLDPPSDSDQVTTTMMPGHELDFVVSKKKSINTSAKKI